MNAYEVHVSYLLKEYRSVLLLRSEIYVLYFYLIDEIVFMHPIKVFKLLTIRAFLSSCTWYHMLFTWLFVIQSLNFAERFVPACA